MAVQNKELCGIDTAGSLAKIFNLPNDKMGISAGKYVMYVYDQNSQKVSQSLYLVAHGGKYSKLIEIHKPINAVIEYRNSPLFATGNTLFHLDPKVREPKVFVALPSNDIIKSATIDTSSNRVYVATDNMVYAVKDSNVVLVTDKFGGIIRFLDGGLIVFNPEKKYLIRILGVENKITSQFIEPKTSQSKEQPSDIITNAMVIDMVKLKLSDRLIINMINKSDANFNLGVDEMIFLSGQNVSSEVIMAMKNAMRRKASNAPNNTKQ
ncbi:MAG: hypothetical protein M0Q53_17480 [Prolixibacteraceae bacterium]|nr:hypothetical protein [Prolixibacteraceae bacterium]